MTTSISSEAQNNDGMDKWTKLVIKNMFSCDNKIRKIENMQNSNHETCKIRFIFLNHFRHTDGQNNVKTRTGYV